MKLSHEEIYKKLCEKYPKINYIEGEDLNIQNHVLKMVEKCYFDTEKYKTICDVAKKLEVSERFIFRFANDNNFKQRKKSKRKLTDFTYLK